MWKFSDKDIKLNEFCKGLCEGICDILNIRNRGVKLSKSLYVLKHTSMKSALLEVDFISNESCEKNLRNEENLKTIASIIKDNVLKLCDIVDNNQSLYRVCIGSYRDKSNAISALSSTKSKGFSDAYII